MAGSPFSISSLLGWLKSFLRSMPSPLGGFDMRDAQVNAKGDIFSSRFSFEADPSKFSVSDVAGNKIELDVLLRVINAREVFSPILKGMNTMSDMTKAMLKDNMKGLSPFLDLLLGKERAKDNDNSLSAARARGTGLLGVKLDKMPLDEVVKYEGKDWSWQTIAEDYLRYSLECETPESPYGAIENQQLKHCGELISEYLVKTDVITDASEVKVDISILVLPILNEIQKWLIEYYEEAYKKFVDENGTGYNPEEGQEGENPEGQQNNDNGQAPTADNTGEGNPMDTSGQQASPNASKHINVTLQKVTATSEIKMTAIKANYNPSEVLDDMEEVMEQDEFIDSITEEPQTFNIQVDDDGFDIERCEGCQECDPCESLGEALKTAIQAYRNLYIIHWMSFGNDMMKTHLLAEDMYEEMIKEIDTLGELMVEKCGTIIDPNFPCEYIEVKNFEFQESLDVIKSLIQPYIDALDFAYCNQDSDVQSTFDEWLRYWKKQLNYFVNRQEI